MQIHSVSFYQFTHVEAQAMIHTQEMLIGSEIILLCEKKVCYEQCKR